jgi:hypothetical protein
MGRCNTIDVVLARLELHTVFLALVKEILPFLRQEEILTKQHH